MLSPQVIELEYYCSFWSINFTSGFSNGFQSQYTWFKSVFTQCSHFWVGHSPFINKGLKLKEVPQTTVILKIRSIRLEGGVHHYLIKLNTQKINHLLALHKPKRGLACLKTYTAVIHLGKTELKKKTFRITFELYTEPLHVCHWWVSLQVYKLTQVVSIGFHRDDTHSLAGENPHKPSCSLWDLAGGWRVGRPSPGESWLGVRSTRSSPWCMRQVGLHPLSLWGNRAQDPGKMGQVCDNTSKGTVISVVGAELGVGEG